MYILIYKYVSYFIKREWRRFIYQINYWKFCQFSLQIGAEHIAVCPSFVHCNWRSRAGPHRRQPATLPGGEKWRLRSEYRRWKRFFWFGVLVLSRLVVLSGWDDRQQFLPWIGHRIDRRLDTLSPIPFVAGGGAMSSFAIRQLLSWQ